MIAKPLNDNLLVERTQMRVILFVLMISFVSISGCESREEARKREAHNMLKQVGLALQNYHSTHSEPPSSKEPDKDDAEGR
jgi:hypothetical protein